MSGDARRWIGAGALVAALAGCGSGGEKTLLPPDDDPGPPAEYATCAQASSDAQDFQEYFGSWTLVRACGGQMGGCTDADPDAPSGLTLSDNRLDRFESGRLESSFCIHYLVAQSIGGTMKDMVECADGDCLRYSLELVEGHLQLGEEAYDGRGYDYAPSD